MSTDDRSSGRPLTRREALEIGWTGAAGLMLAGSPALWAKDGEKGAAAGPAPKKGKDVSPTGPATLPAGKAKAVIQVWLWGGPSHLDTFDPKPAAGRDYCGPYAKPIATNVDGLQIGPSLPLLAKIADKYAILRGMTHGNNGHETAAYLVQAGHKSGEDAVFPGVGAVVTYCKTSHGSYKGILPPYITLTRPQGRFSESGFLGAKYKPFATGGDPSREPFTVEGVVAENITEERQKDRRALLGEMDRFGKEMSADPMVKSLDNCQQQAYEMILGDAGKTFALNEEKAELRDRYGRSTFGQSCLLARRLVERGVIFITINHGGWDTHKQHFQAMAQKLPQLDAGLSTLIQDLSDRGLLDSTIVWVSGEFGRTPKIDWQPPWNGGRGHYGKAFSALVAGGGFRGGRVVGKTNDRGEIVTERPIYPWDLLGSFYTLLGIDLKAKMTSPRGESAAVSPLASGEIKETGGLLKEIMG
jgi:hypothetical protein